MIGTQSVREREIRCNKLYARLFVFRLFEVYYYKKDIDYSASWLGGWLLFVFIVALFPKLMLNGPISHVRMCDTGFGVHYKIDKSVSDWKFAWLFYLFEHNKWRPCLSITKPDIKLDFQSTEYQNIFHRIYFLAVEFSLNNLNGQFSFHSKWIFFYLSSIIIWRIHFFYFRSICFQN